MTSIPAQQTPGEDQLYDIVVLEPASSVWPLVFWLLAALLIAIVISLAVFYFIKNRKEPGAAGAAKAAAERFRKIESALDEEEANESAIAISDVLKDYLQARFNDPVRYETAQEFLMRASEAGSNLPDTAQQYLREFLLEGDEVKFGNTDGIGAKLHPLLQTAKTIIAICEKEAESFEKNATQQSPPG